MPKNAPRSGDPIPATPQSTADRIRDAAHTGYLLIPSRLYNRIADEYMQSCNDRRAPFLIVATRSKVASIDFDLRPNGNSNLTPVTRSMVFGLLAEHSPYQPYANEGRQIFRALVDLQHAEFIATRIVAILGQCTLVPNE